MKFVRTLNVKRKGRPAPHGAGGLKFAKYYSPIWAERSRPARGGWIEISVGWDKLFARMSRPARGGWIEISVLR